MQASRNLLPKGTTLMLPADSELFELLQDSAYFQHGGQTTRTVTKTRSK